MNVRNELFQLARKSKPSNYAIVCFYLLYYQKLYDRLFKKMDNEWAAHERAIRIFSNVFCGKVKDDRRFLSYMYNRAKQETAHYAKHAEGNGSGQYMLNTLQEHAQIFSRTLKVDIDNERLDYARVPQHYHRAVNSYFFPEDTMIAANLEELLAGTDFEMTRDSIQQLLSVHSAGPTFANEDTALRFYKDKIVEQGDIIDEFVTDYLFNDLPLSKISNKYGSLSPGVYASVAYVAVCRSLWDRWPLHIILYRLKNKKTLKAHASAA